MPTFYTVGLCAEHLRISTPYLVEYKNVPWSKSSMFTSEMLKVAENMNKSAVVIFYLRIHRGAPDVSSERRAITPQSFKNNYDVLFETWTRARDTSLRKHVQPCTQNARFNRRCLTANSVCGRDV